MLTQYIQQRIDSGIMSPVIKSQEDDVVIGLNSSRHIKLGEIFFCKAQTSVMGIDRSFTKVTFAQFIDQLLMGSVMGQKRITLDALYIIFLRNRICPQFVLY